MCKTAARYATSCNEAVAHRNRKNRGPVEARAITTTSKIFFYKGECLDEKKNPQYSPCRSLTPVPDTGYPTSNYYLSESLWTGGLNGTNAMRTYIKFDIPGIIPASQITSATIRIRKKEHLTPMVKAYRVLNSWSSSSITWNNKPGYTTTGASSTISLDSVDWYKLDVTAMVKNWRNGTYGNYGVVLKEPSELSYSQKTKYYSSDAPSPNKPELIVNYSGSTPGYVSSRPYQSTARQDVNCMGYALEYGEYITGADLDISESEMSNYTTEQMLAYIKVKAESWMAGHLGSSGNGYSSISTYNSNISTNCFRVVLRVGFIDSNSNNKYNTGENWDYHWWYQTSNNGGDWADKMADGSSSLRSGSSGLNPANQTWANGSLYYNSEGVFYSIVDTRNINWG
jgi:hypothetical protein